MIRRLKRVATMKIQLSDHFSYGRMIVFVIPSIVMSLFTSVYSIVDGFFISNFVGITEFAAVNLVMPVLFILGIVGYMFGAGGSALIAKTLGEGDRDRANRLFSLFVLLSFVVALVMTILGFAFMPQVVSLLGAEGALHEYGTLYGRILITSLPLWILLYEFQLLFVTAEKPRLGLLVTVIAGLLNIALDALFILVFDWELAGAALASAISQGLGGLFPIVYFSCRNSSLLRFTYPRWDGVAVKRCVFNGSSEFMSGVAMSILSIVYNLQLLHYVGSSGVAVYGVLMYVGMIFSAIFIGFAEGIGPVFSFHYGAENHGELRNLRMRSLRIVVVCSVTMFLLCELMAYPVSFLFMGSVPELLSMTTHAFRIYAVSYLFMGTAIFGTALFTALNNGGVSALIAVLRTWVFELGAVFLLPLFMGIDGIWSSIVVAELMAATCAIVFMVAFRKKYQY